MGNKLILIAGGTASGKTMIANVLVKEYINKGLSATLMGMDNYYKSLDSMSEKNGEDVNWDSPNVIDWDQFLIDINKLKNGENVKKMSYDFASYTHKGKEVEYIASEYIIIEGIFTLYKENIRNISDSKVFVDVDDDIRLIRRIERDKNGRYKDKFDTSVFMKKWKEEIKPMHKKYVQPTLEYSDFVIKNNNDFIGEEKNKMINLLHSIVLK